MSASPRIWVLSGRGPYLLSCLWGDLIVLWIIDWTFLPGVLCWTPSPIRYLLPRISKISIPPPQLPIKAELVLGWWMERKEKGCITARLSSSWLHFPTPTHIPKAKQGQSSHIQGEVGGSNNSKRVLGRGGNSPVGWDQSLPLGGGVLHSSPVLQALPWGGGKC